MQNKELIELLDIPFSFSEQPAPLEPQLRVIWGMSILVLILKICSRGRRSSIPRLHLINWSLRNNRNRERLIELLENNLSPWGGSIGYDPGFSRAIEYAIAESIVGLDENTENLRVHLSEKGRTLADEIIEIEDCLAEEKKFLREKCAPVNETFVKRFLRRR